LVGLFRLDPDLRLPPLWRSEFRHVLLKYLRAGILDYAKALGLWVKAFGRFGLQEEPVDSRRVLELTIKSGRASYDAGFVVLTKQLVCCLLTFDRSSNSSNSGNRVINFPAFKLQRRTQTAANDQN
jgi:predicted nucleic acid-binding protein